MLPLPDRPAGQRLLQIDGLRGIAAVSVVFFHTKINEAFWMWSFVDLFFVLSGFLITSILFYTSRPSFLSVRNFYIRRAFRIWPVYYLTLAYCLCFAYLIRGEAFAWPYAGVRSFLFLQFVDFYWADPARIAVEWSRYVPFFAHSWSLAVEEQYYLIWPGLVFALRARPRLLAGMCFAWIALSVVLGLMHLPYVLLMTRADGLALGSLLALYLRPNGVAALQTTVLTRWLVLAGVVGVAIIAPYLLTGYEGATASRYQTMVADFNLTLPILGFALLFVAVLGYTLTRGQSSAAEHPVVRVLSSRPLVYLGSVSYALYMFHQPVFYSAAHLAPGLSPGWRGALAWVVLFAAAQVSRVLIERHFERAKHRYPLGMA